jgi:hypothetical protein
MAISAFVGSFTVPASTGNQSTTGVGFQPKVVFFWGNGYTADGDTAGPTSRVLASPYWGFGLSSSSRVAMTEGDDGVTANNTATDATKCLKRISGSTTIFAADLVSLDADGFTVNFTTANASAFVINYLALGGADLSSVFLKSFTSASATGNQATTGVGFQPDVIWLMGADNSASNNSTNIGFGKSSSARATSSQAANATTGGCVQKTTKVYTNLDGSNSIRCEADLVTLDSDGFTLNWTTANANTHTIYALCLKGPSLAVGSFTQKTSTGSQSTTGVGFLPKAMTVVSAGLTAGAAIAGHQDVMTAAASSTTQRAVVEYEAGNKSVSLLNRALIYRIDSDTGSEPGGTVLGSADLTSFDADGFTLNYGTSDATAREVIYLALGDAASSPTAATGGNLKGQRTRPAAFKPMGDAFRPGKYQSWR